jgi:DNA-directed RNA polymerase subunit N (RpoN/RPB10)
LQEALTLYFYFTDAIRCSCGNYGCWKVWRCWNAATVCVSILSTSDETIAEKLRAYRKKVAEKMEEKNKIIAETGLAAYIKKLEGNND